MKTEHHTINVNEISDISSVWLIPDHPKTVLIIAHGAGNDMNSDFISYLHKTIGEQDIITVKFNFPYKEKGRKAPDREPVLKATWQAVIDTVIAKTGYRKKQIFLSGKSMGGRYATMIAAEQEDFGGLIVFGYPLHAPGKTDRLRADHLSLIQAPMLFFEGTRDPMCKLDALQTVLASLHPHPDLHIIEGGDHSFKVVKKLNRTEAEVWEEIAGRCKEWISLQV